MLRTLQRVSRKAVQGHTKSANFPLIYVDEQAHAGAAARFACLAGSEPRSEHISAQGGAAAKL